MTGISVAGLGLVGKHGVTGVSLSGLGLVAGEGSITGVNVAGLGLVSGDAITGISATVGMARAKGSITGVTFAGYRMKAPVITGLNVAIGWTDANILSGVSCAAYHQTAEMQKGLVVGVFNNAEDLQGIQIGLLNHVESNPAWARWLPIINAKF